MDVVWNLRGAPNPSRHTLTATQPPAWRPSGAAALAALQSGMMRHFFLFYVHIFALPHTHVFRGYEAQTYMYVYVYIYRRKSNCVENDQKCLTDRSGSRHDACAALIRGHIAYRSYHVWDLQTRKLSAHVMSYQPPRDYNTNTLPCPPACMVTCALVTRRSEIFPK